MPDRDLEGFSRVCLSCGRRVPRNVVTCRCGVALAPADLTAAPVAQAASSGGGSSAIVAVAIAVLMAAGAGYWFFVRPATVTMERKSVALAAVGSQEPGAARAASPEARAWDAAANAKDAPASGAAPTAPDSPAAPPTKLTGSIEEMVDRVMPAIVLIETTGGRGSGFYVRHDTLITNAHVVQRGIPGDAAAGCLSYYEGLESNIKQFHGVMRRLLNDARRANVLPGTIRDQLRTNRLDFEW